MAACRVQVEDPFSLEEARPGPARSVPPDKQQAMAWEVLLPDRAHPSASAAQVRWAPVQPPCKCFVSTGPDGWLSRVPAPSPCVLLAVMRQCAAC